MNVKKTILAFAGVLICCLFFVMSCKKKEILPDAKPAPLTFTVPAGFPPIQYDFTNNPLTQQGFDLGKKIFYDPRLSSDGQVSCENCHQQFAGFVMFDHDLAHGVGGQHTTRNPQPLVNLAWHKEMMWDGGINNIEVQPLAPFTAPNEMNLSLAEVISKLNADPVYKQMFKAAFGDENINSQRMLKALTQFMVMLVSSNSKYDKVKRGEASFDALENIGYQAFQAKCNSCHTEPLFTDLSYRNIGLTRDPFLLDHGRMKITNNPLDSLKFKVPTLRNTEFSKPYTHDGRFGSLDVMIDHYRFNVVQDPTTDPLVRNRISISATEKAGLIAFIKTLTDTSFTRNPKFAR